VDHSSIDETLAYRVTPFDVVSLGNISSVQV
jgi:hypothetical protein